MSKIIKETLISKNLKSFQIEPVYFGSGLSFDERVEQNRKKDTKRITSDDASSLENSKDS